MKRRLDSGMTLIELLIALGVGAIVIYAVTMMLTTTGKESDSLAAKNEFNEMVSQIQMVLNNPTACRAAFTGQFATPANKTNVPSLANLGAPGTGAPIPIALDVGNTAKGGVAIFQAGTQLPHSKLTVMNFELLGKRASNTMPDPTDPLKTKVVANQYEVPLHILVSRREGGYSTATSTDSTTGSVTTTMSSRQGGSATGGDFLEKIITMRVALDDAGQHIVGCSGQNAPGWRSTGPLGNAACKTPKAGDPPCFDIAYMGNVDGPFGIYSKSVVDRANVGIDSDGLNAFVPALDQFKNKVKLDISGSAMSVKYTYRSDARYKKNVRPIPDALSRIEQLHGVVFDWKNENHGKGDQIGFLAQEVERAFPETVKTGADGLKSVSYQSLVAPLVEAVKERQKILDQQERDLAEIRRSLGQ